MMPIIYLAFLSHFLVEATFVCPIGSNLVLIHNEFKCYIPAPPLSNKEARANCASQGGNLITVKSKSDETRIIKSLQKFGYYGTWVSTIDFKISIYMIIII